MLAVGPRDDPEAYLAGDRRRALAAGRDLPDRVRGAALFADISGFTPLTEALAASLGAQRGAEELTAILDRVVGAVLAELHRYGGSVIYFSGDAVTCWLDGDDGLLAAACALRMQAAMHRVGRVRTPDGRQVRLAMKVAVAVGPARRCVVGDPEIQLIDVLAGSLMDELAAAERAAAKGEVRLSSAAVRSLGDRADVGPGGVLHRLAVDVPPVPPPPATAPLPEDTVRQWLLPPVYERMLAGRGEFLAELRPAIPLFLRFGGLDFDTDEAAPAKLDDFIRGAQRVVDSYGGSTLQLTVGDKGSYLYAVFGSPIAHEDDAARVCGAALDLLALEAGSPVSGLQIGITHGRLRSGTYGHRQRRTFCCLGDAVNLAARLMSAAPSGAAWVADAVVQAAGPAYTFGPLPSMKVKGKSDPVRAWTLTGRGAAPVPVRAEALVGRAHELAELTDFLAPAVDSGHGRLVGVSGEAGVGKSRLLGELAAGLAARGVVVAHGVAQAYGTSASYAAWQPVWRTLLGVDAAAADRPPAELLDELAARLPEPVRPRTPLLGGLLGLPLPDNDLTAHFDAQLRKTALESTAGEALAAMARRQPVLIVIEDAQRLDALSQDLLAGLARAAADLPVAIALAYRPGEAFGGLPLAGMPHVLEHHLGPLDVAATTLAVEERLRLLYGPDQPLSAELVAFVVERAEGNPLYVRELAAYLHQRGVDPATGGLTDLDLPESLHSLMLSRIDILGEELRRTAKVASVVGRTFRAGLLPEVYPELGDVTEPLVALAAGDVVIAEQRELATHAFTHAIVCDVAYESVPFALRTELHEAVARCLERGADGDPARQLDRLAYHYGRSENAAKKLEYTLRAGIAAQAEYANAAALAHFRTVLPLLPEPDRAPVLVRTGKVLELVGEWTGAASAYSDALTVAEVAGDQDAGAWARTWLAEVARKRGRFDEAAEGLAEAGERFRALGNEAGVGQVLHLSGTLAAQRGEYPAATAAYRASLRIRERLGDLASMGALFSNLAIVEEYQGRYAEAQQLNEQALELRLRDGDRRAIGVSQNNLGMIAVLRGDFVAATERFVEAMRLHELVGDAWMVALGHNNLGNAYRGLGNAAAAGQEYRAALATYRAHGDDWALAILYEDVAQLATAELSAELTADRPVAPAARAKGKKKRRGGEPRGNKGYAGQAALLFGAADGTRERIGSPRAPDVQAQVDRAVDVLRTRLGPALRPLMAQGRKLPPIAADALVLSVCD